MDTVEIWEEITECATLRWAVGSCAAGPAIPLTGTSPCPPSVISLQISPSVLTVSSVVNIGEEPPRKCCRDGGLLVAHDARQLLVRDVEVAVGRLGVVVIV